MSDSGFDFPDLDKKIAGHSVWVWGAVLGGAVVLYLWWSGRGSSDVTVDPAVDTSTGFPGVQAGGFGGGGGGGVVDTGTDTGDGTDVSEPPIPPTNQDWEAKAVNALIALGVPAVSAQTAVEKYLYGETLTFTEYQHMNQVLRQIGLPPMGTQATPTHEPRPATHEPKPKPKPKPKPRHKPKPKPKHHETRHKLKHHPKPKHPKRGGARHYTVKRGDTLSEIALRYYGHGTRHYYMKIANANGIRNPDLIHPGRKLVIPR